MSAREANHLILTVDYELFGNGSGCPAKCVIAPTERILSIASRYSTPVTLFVEALEFMAMEGERATSADADAVKAQIRSAVRSGHDVQLHLHPQWVNASFGTNHRWALDLEKWRIGDLKVNEVAQLLASGKAWLETVLRPVESNYACYAFRAGGWCIQPSLLVLQALNELDFRVDSTVAPGLRDARRGAWFDFRAAPRKPCWRVAQDVCQESRTGIWEIPIVVARVSAIDHGRALLRRKWSRASEFAAGCSGSYASANITWNSLVAKAFKFPSLGSLMLDISTVPATMLIAAVRNWLSRFAQTRQPIPIVAIGHTKNFTAQSEAELETFLRWAVTEDYLVLSRYDTWLRKVDNFPTTAGAQG